MYTIFSLFLFLDVQWVWVCWQTEGTTTQLHGTKLLQINKSSLVYRKSYTWGVGYIRIDNIKNWDMGKSNTIFVIGKVDRGGEGRWISRFFYIHVRGKKGGGCNCTFYMQHFSTSFSTFEMFFQKKLINMVCFLHLIFSTNWFYVELLCFVCRSEHRFIYKKIK